MECAYSCLDSWRFGLLTNLYRKFYKEKIPFAGKSVLNVGAGFGRESRFILSQGPRFLILSDMRHNRLSVAQDNLLGIEKKYFLCADAHDLPFKKKSVDIVSLFETLHHIEDPFRCLENLIDVAKSAIVLDEPRQSRLRSSLNYLFVGLGIKEMYEKENQRELRFRLDRGTLKTFVLKHNLDAVCYPYFIYYFPFPRLIQGKFKARIYRILLIFLNKVFHFLGNRIIVILKLKR